MAEDIYDKQRRVRPARVVIGMDVEKGDAEPDSELPFVVGVMGDFSGNDPGVEKKPLRDRSFRSIDKFNFDSVVAAIAPGLNIEVPDTEAGSDSMIRAKLQFRSMGDFLPDRVARQIPQLSALIDQREALKDLLGKEDPKTRDLLDEILSDAEKMKKFISEVQNGT